MPGLPWIFLAVSLIGAAFTWNAWYPSRSWRVLRVPSFFAGWLTSELAAHHIAWQAIATVIFVAAGALAEWPGRVGLAVTICSWAGLLGQLRLGRGSGETVESALAGGLGEGYRERISPDWAPKLDSPDPRGRLLNPFRFRDAEVTRVCDLPYVEGGGARQCLDIYAPRGGARNAPVLLQIHGGAWTIGNKRQQALPLMMHLSRRGWICVAANYRLSPRATFPDHLIDVKQALRWIRENIAEYGGDPGFVAITGGSAGGHLSALAALTGNRPEFQPGFEDADTSVQAAVPFYGAYDFTNSLDHAMGAGLVSFVERVVLKKKFAEEREAFERASPLHYISPDAPPFFIVHGTHDSLLGVDDARIFSQKLRAVSRAPVVYAELRGAQHAFELFHSPRTHHVIRGVHRFLGAVYSEYLKTIEKRGVALAVGLCALLLGSSGLGCAGGFDFWRRQPEPPPVSAKPPPLLTDPSTLDWSEHLEEWLPAIDACLARTASGPAVAVYAWSASPGHVGVRTRAGDRRWDCVARADGAAVEKFGAVPPPEKHPAESSPLFSRTPLEPPSGSCYDHERAFSQDGRFLGWLSYDVCG
jgi:acetyl esterase/lipase